MSVMDAHVEALDEHFRNIDRHPEQVEQELQEAEELVSHATHHNHNSTALSGHNHVSLNPLPDLRVC